jgi:hypothetical protein
MFGRRNQTDFLNDGTAREWCSPRSNRARRRDRERGEAELVSDLRWQWRSACAGTSLGQVVYTPSGPTRAVPLIGHVDLGPPVTFTVRVRPGQTLADFVAAAPSIAPALNVAALQVTPLVPQWVRIVLLPAPLVALPDRPYELNVEALKFGRNNPAVDRDLPA